MQLNEMVYEVHRPPHDEYPESEIVLFHGLQLKQCKESYITTWMSHNDSNMASAGIQKAWFLTISYDSTMKT